MNGLSIEKTSLDTAVAAKMIRKALKKAYPATKFSVRSSRYSMGSSIYIHFTNGPTSNDVESIAKGTVGAAGFDGSDDSTYYNDSEMIMTADGPVIYRCGAYISATREVSDDQLDRFIAENDIAAQVESDPWHRSLREIARGEINRVAL